MNFIIHNSFIHIYKQHQDMEQEITTKDLMRMILENQKDIKENQKDIQENQKDIQENQKDIKENQKDIKAPPKNPRGQPKGHQNPHAEVLNPHSEIVETISPYIQSNQEWFWEIIFFLIKCFIIIPQIIDSVKKRNEQAETQPAGLGANWSLGITILAIAYLLEDLIIWSFECWSSKRKVEAEPRQIVESMKSSQDNRQISPDEKKKN